MGWFWDKQPPSVRLCSCAYKHKRVLYQGGDESKRMKGTLSYLADDKKNDNTHEARTAYARARAQTHTFAANLFEKWRKFHTVITQLTAVILLFLISSSPRQTCAYAHAHCARARTHTPSWQKHRNHFNVQLSSKTSGVSTKQTAFLVVMKLQQQALINTNTGMLETKILAHMGVILASKTVASLLSWERDAPLLLHYGAFLT